MADENIAEPTPTPLLKVAGYGPAYDEYSHDQLYGPFGHLRDGQVAISPNQEHRYPLGSGPYDAVDEQGNIVRTGIGVADHSYISPGVPNVDTVEFWNDRVTDTHSHLHLVQAKGWKASGFTPNDTGYKAQDANVPHGTGSIYNRLLSKHPEYDQGSTEKNLKWMHDNLFSDIPEDKFNTWAQSEAGAESIRNYGKEKQTGLQSFRKKHPEFDQEDDDSLTHKLYSFTDQKQPYGEFKEKINPTQDWLAATWNAFADNVVHGTAAALLKLPGTIDEFNLWMANHPWLSMVSPLGYFAGQSEKDFQSSDYFKNYMRAFATAAEEQHKAIESSPESMKPGVAKAGALVGEMVGQIPGAVIQYPMSVAKTGMELAANTGALIADAFAKERGSNFDQVAHDQHVKKLVEGATDLDLDMMQAFLVNSPYGRMATGAIGSMIGMGADKFKEFLNGDKNGDLFTDSVRFATSFGLWSLAGKGKEKPPEPEPKKGSALTLKQEPEEVPAIFRTEPHMRLNVAAFQEALEGKEHLDNGDIAKAADSYNRALAMMDGETKVAHAKEFIKAVEGKGDPKFFDEYHFGFSPSVLTNWLERIMPIVRKRVDPALRAATQPILKMTAPEMLEERPTAGAAATEATTRASRRLKLGLPALGRMFDHSDQFWFGEYAKRHRSFWQKYSEDKLYSMLSAYEHGESTGHAEADHLLGAYHKIQDFIYDWDQKEGIKYRKRSHYLYHAFKNKEQAEYFYSKYQGLFGGKGGYTKPRYFEDVNEARRNGFKLKSVNPFDLLSLRWYQSVQDHFMLETVHKLEDWGEAFSGDKATKQIKDNPSYVQFNDAPDSKAYWIRNDKIPTLRNAFDNRPLELLGPTLRFFRNAKGYSLGLKLLGAFHGVHIAVGLNQAERFSTMVEKIRAGNFRAKDMHDAMSLMGGDNTSAIMDYYKNKVELSSLSGPELELVRYLDRSGIDPTKNEERSLEFVAKLPIPRAVGGGIDHVAEVGYGFTRWITGQNFFFENMIPRMKIEALRQRVDALRESNPELFSPRAEKWLSMKLREFGLDIDRRFGERNYRTLFTPKWMKDIGISGLLSLSWDMSFINAGGVGAIYDLTRNVYHFDEIMKAARRGDSLNGRFLTNRALFTASLSMITAAINGFITGVMTGQAPQGEDFLWPRIGKNPDGSDKRLNTPFWITEWARIANYVYQDGPIAGPWRFLQNKIQPVGSTALELIQNRDYFGRKIYEGNAQVIDGKLENWGQLSARVLGEVSKFAAENMLEPIFIESTFTHPPAGMTWGDRVLAFFGFNPAPTYARFDRAGNEIMKAYRDLHGTAANKHMADVSDARGAYRTAFENKDAKGMQEARRELLKLGANEKQIKGIEKTSHETTPQRLFKSLDTHEAVRIMMGMSPQELKEYWPYAGHKAKEEYNRQHHGPMP